MAGVYLARSLATGEPVAIKLLLKKFADDADFQRRFLREADFVARLKHPNIIQLLHVEPCEERLFIVMEYVGGGDLRARIARGMSIADSLAVVQQLAEALNAAHAMGITHRDIKPSNVLFREDGTVVLADFGIAKAVNQETNLTLTGMIPGTPRYMSPEQARSRPIDGRSDYYSLGILLYEMLTGAAPFVGTDPVSTALMHITEPIPQLGGKAAYLQPLLEQLLVKEPEQRISSSEELRAAIARCHAVDATDFVQPESTEVIKLSRFAHLRQLFSRYRYARVGVVIAAFGMAAALALPRIWSPVEEQQASPETAKSELAQEIDKQAQQIASKDKQDATANKLTLAHDRDAAGEAQPADQAPEESAFSALETASTLVEMEANYAPAPAGEDENVLASLSLVEEPSDATRLDELYELGTEQLAQRKLTIPQDDNALQTFNAMLDIDPNDQRARDGIASIVTGYQGLAERRRHSDPEAAMSLLDRGLQIDADNKPLLEMRQQLQAELEERLVKNEVGDLVAKAETQLEARKYVRPPGDNAYESLRAARAKAPDDPKIARAFDRLLQQVSAQARKQQKLENWQAALTYVDDALRIAPRDAALIARKEQINAALQQAEATDDDVAKQIDTLPEEPPKKRKRRIIGNF